MFNLRQLKHFFVGDGDEGANLNHLMKRKQYIIGICAFGLLLLTTVILHNLSKKDEKHPVNAKPKETAVVDGVVSTDFTQKNELSALEQQQFQLDHMRKELTDLRQASPWEGAHKEELIKQIQDIIAQREAGLHLPLTRQAGEMPFSDAHSREWNQGIETVSAPQLETIHFNYDRPQVAKRIVDQKPWQPPAKTPKTYVSAGTFARAVLLEGADANASVNGQSDTVGILLRVLDNGTLPNGHHSHLKGCFVLASIYGDISSERGEARLTNFSCTRADGTILERKVQGYLSFAGKEGIRGKPVMRNGKILAMSGLSGMFSGIGSALQQSIQTQSISPLGVTSTVPSNQVWQNGAYGGASTAMGQLAHYYIQRADQYHPVIEIGSGTVATVIFQSGFSLLDEDQQDNVSQTLQTTVENNSIAETEHTEKVEKNEEIKTLLNEAQNQSSAKETEPFSNVN